MPIPLGILAVAGAGGAAGAYDLLETQVLSSAAASVTFTGLGSYTSYKHLQIRYVAQKSGGAPTNKIQFNSDTGANYNDHVLAGNGSSVVSNYFPSVNFMPFLTSLTADGASFFSPGVIDILDFSNINKNTTKRLFMGLDRGEGGSQVSLRSGLWINTAAITSIVLDANGNNFVAGSRFSLYGVK